MTAIGACSMDAVCKQDMVARFMDLNERLVDIPTSAAAYKTIADKQKQVIEHGLKLVR